jgi:hypothetical protein
MLKNDLSEKENEQLQRLMKTEPIKQGELMYPNAAKLLLSKNFILKNKDGEYIVNWSLIKDYE